MTPSTIDREVDGKSYSILLEQLAAFTPIRLTNGKWNGVVYHYGKVRLLEEDEHLRIQFSYTVIENDKLVVDANAFLQYIGDILVDILDHNINNNLANIPIMSQNEMGFIGDT